SYTRTRRDEQFQFFFTLFGLFRGELFIIVKTGFGFRMASLWGHSHPLQLPLQGLLTLCLLLFFLCKTFGFLIQPRRVITFPWDTFAAVKLQDPAGNVI